MIRVRDLPLRLQSKPFGPKVLLYTDNFVNDSEKVHYVNFVSDFGDTGTCNITHIPFTMQLIREKKQKKKQQHNIMLKMHMIRKTRTSITRTEQRFRKQDFHYVFNLNDITPVMELPLRFYIT